MKNTLRIILVYLALGISMPLWAENDSSKIAQKELHQAAAAATPSAEKGLEELFLENQKIYQETQKAAAHLTASKSISKAASVYSKNKTTDKKVVKKHPLKQKKQEKRYTPQSKKKSNIRERNPWNWGSWAMGFKWLELDWWLVGFCIFLFLGLMFLMFFLLANNVLSLFQMILLSLGFGFAMFSYIFLSSETDGARGAYDFFVKYGLFSWVGIMAIIAGFAGLFGASGAFSSYLLIGLVIGGLSFIISLILGDSIFLGYEFRKF